MKTKIFYILILSLIAFTSCRSTKTEVKKATKQLAVDSIYYKMQSNQFKTEWFSGKFKAIYQTPEKKQAFSGQVRLHTDSIYWVSIYAMMNIEVFRLEIRPDSFRFVNRLNKTYMNESMSFFKEKFGIDIDLEMLQALLLGDDFPYYETDVFKLIDHKSQYQLSTAARKKLEPYNEDKSKILMQNIWIDKNTFKISKQCVKIIGEDRAKLRVNYSNFEEINNMLFAMNRILKLKDNQNSFLEIKFNKINTDQELKFPFRIPKKYTEYEVPKKN